MTGISHPGFSIHRSSLSEADLEELRQEVEILNRHRGVGLRDTMKSSDLIARQVENAFGLRSPASSASTTPSMRQSNMRVSERRLGNPFWTIRLCISAWPN